MPQSNATKSSNKSPWPAVTGSSVSKPAQPSCGKKLKNLTATGNDSSSDEEDLAVNKIVESVFKNYAGNVGDLKKTQDFLESSLISGAAVCLVCIETVRRPDKIWSCVSCSCIFHLSCIQRWANESIAMKRIRQDQEEGYYNNQGDYIPKKVLSIEWACPQCRTHFPPNEIPRHYECFCGKERNPPQHPWLMPHSCGETCRKQLIPKCGHTCTLLCHPGACPPCPQMITMSCKCENTNAKVIRCFQMSWTCGKICNLMLACNIHLCGASCHSRGECPPCGKRSFYQCQCGNETSERNCSQSVWSCGKLCGKQYSCGLHRCKKICHADPCGDCPLGLPRSCPCGNQNSIAPCSEPIISCGDTCYKPLACGLHKCMLRCHKGPCNECLEVVEKRCVCGSSTKQIPCSKTFSCENKCKLMKDCSRHYCRKKCCDGNCPPCDKICGNTLSCKKHKCTSLCHLGPCYPCTKKQQLACRCGGSLKTVPCGQEKKTKPPKCRLPCKIPMACHHKNPHTCHANECPPCVQKCSLPNTSTNCGHLCEVKCHAAVSCIVKSTAKPAGPWEVLPVIYETKKLPHPECKQKVMVTCIGGHDTSLQLCGNSKPRSCGCACNRKLKCGNHNCMKDCHTVEDLFSINEQSTCEPCERACSFPLPGDCVHPCEEYCHPFPCSPCTKTIKTNCHCGLIQVCFDCSEFNKITQTKEEMQELVLKREKLLCCGERCVKLYPCGHRCTSSCHAGVCANPEMCSKRVKIYCKCKNRKKEISCQKYREGETILTCDDQCLEKARIVELKTLDAKQKMKELEDEKNRSELIEYEKKMGRKKHRERKKAAPEAASKSNYTVLLKIALVIAIISVIMYFIAINA